MTVRTFLFTLIHGSERIERSIVAHSSTQAMLTGLRTSPPIDAPCAITCKPIPSQATHWPTWRMPL